MSNKMLNRFKSMPRHVMLRLVGVTLIVLALGACGDWFTTFARQPAIHPWQAATMDSTQLGKTPPRGNPAGSVSLYGEALPDWVFSYSNTSGTVDSMGVLVNPIPASEASINRGHRYYQINCAVCHGDKGGGDGPASKLGVIGIPINQTNLGLVARPDGYIYGMIRNGKASMPSYNRIEAADRWDIVNYVRGLQGKLGREVPTGPLGVPGETGTKLPGATLTAPQRPLPHFPPSRIGGGE